MRLGRVPELHDERVAFEHLLNDPSLDSLASPMDEANFANPRVVRRVDVLLDDGRDVAGRERVQVDKRFDWNAVRVAHAAW